MIKTSIIIPVWNQLEMTKKCIDSINACTKDFEIIVVDNGSNPAYSGPEKIIRNETNLGFPVAVNQGIKCAEGENIVILNNDTLVSPDWLERMEVHLKNYDIVGPVSKNVSGAQQIEAPMFRNLESFNDFANILYSKNKGQSEPFHRLVFFCVLIKGSVIDKIGMLDEQFSPGNFEDDDFCLRAIESGFKLGIAKDVFIHHFGSITHKALNLDYQKLLEVNKAKFESKWPVEKYHQLVKKAIVMSLDIPPVAQYDLTLVIIAKNEALGLEACIKSARPYVKKVIVSVDYSSTDKTIEIAKEFADHVKYFIWEDDFSAARNFAHCGVETKWILFLDGHETLEKWPAGFQFPDNDIDGLAIPIQMENGVIFPGLRIYKNGIRFVGKIHESAECKKVLKADGFLIKHNRLGAQSAESSADRAKQREDQTLRIMGEQLRRNPSNIRASFHLAAFYASRNQFGEAFKMQSQYLKYSKDKEGRWFMFFNRSLAHLTCGHLFRAFWAACMADLEIPGRWEISKLKGLIFYQKCWYDKALKWLTDSFKVNHGSQAYRPWTRDEGGTWSMIGEIFYKKGYYDKAAIAFEEASKNIQNPKFKEITEKRAALMKEMAKNIR